MGGLIVCLTVILVIKICSTIKTEKMYKRCRMYTETLENQAYKDKLNKLFAEFNKEEIK